MEVQGGSSTLGSTSFSSLPFPTGSATLSFPREHNFLRSFPESLPHGHRSYCPKETIVFLVDASQESFPTPTFPRWKGMGVGFRASSPRKRFSSETKMTPTTLILTGHMAHVTRSPKTGQGELPRLLTVYINQDCFTSLPADSFSLFHGITQA